MSALSELLTAANTGGMSLDQVTKRMTELGHDIGRDTVWKYLTGRHPERVQRKYLAAFVAAFPSLRMDVLEEAAKLPADLGPWNPPEEVHSLDWREREALEILIKSIARGKPVKVADTAEQRDDLAERRAKQQADAPDEAEDKIIDWASYGPDYPTQRQIDEPPDPEEEPRGEDDD